MPDQISRQRLKKKALDRWENEGGRVYADGSLATMQKQPGNDSQEMGMAAGQPGNAKRREKLRDTPILYAVDTPQPRA